jgi:hypothetical protein
MQQKLATIAAKTEPAANHDAGLFDLLDTTEPESEMLTPEFASRIARRNISGDGNPSRRPFTAYVRHIIP